MSESIRRTIHVLSIALDVVTSTRDTCRHELAETEHRHRLELQKLNQLDQTMAEQDRSWIETSTRGTSVVVMQYYYNACHQYDLNRIQQLQRIDASSELVNDSRAQLVQANIKCLGLTHVIDAKKEMLTKMENRIEQKNTDEMAAQMYLRNKKNESENQD